MYMFSILIALVGSAANAMASPTSLTGTDTIVGAPEIGGVFDAASYSDFVAQGSMFVVKGSNLGGSDYTPLGFPLPTTFNGIRVTFTPAAGGVGTDAHLLYGYSRDGVEQIAAVLPSTMPVGPYSVSVANGAAVSAPYWIQWSGVTSHCLRRMAPALA
jgi:hypothetical protein